VGQFILAFNPGPLSGGTYAERLEVLLSAITDQPGTRLPGSRRVGVRVDSAANGIDIPDDLIAWMEQVAS
jgi:(2R)-3-sulfolactate dehydrogenase (NADP+)